jgi:hypothetical protein
VSPRRKDDAPFAIQVTPPSPPSGPLQAELARPVPTALPAETSALRREEAVSLPPVAEAPRAATIQRRQRLVTPALAQVLTLLRSPRSVGAALMLREIFDQPLCQRRR